MTFHQKDRERGREREINRLRQRKRERKRLYFPVHNTNNYPSVQRLKKQEMERKIQRDSIGKT